MAANIRLTPTDSTRFDSENTVIIHIQPSITVTKIVELAQCRICQKQTNSDALHSPHKNCKKEICKICLPTLTQCPSCNENINRLPVNTQTQTVIAAPAQQVNRTGNEACSVICLVFLIAAIAALKFLL